MRAYTTEEVAKFCQVSPRTVAKWFDSGRIKGYRIPGSEARRMPEAYVIKFMKEHGLPLPEAFKELSMATPAIAGGSRQGSDTFEQSLRFEARERQDKASRLVEAVRSRLAEVEAMIAKGKGEWPSGNYVRDDTWVGWMAERHCLRTVLERAGLEASLSKASIDRRTANE